MTNIQLYQEFVGPELFHKTYNIPLGHLVTFARSIHKLDPEDKEKIVEAITAISNHREKESLIPDNQKV